MRKDRARHFHAGKLRRTVGGVEFVEVAESKGVKAEYTKEVHNA